VPHPTLILASTSRYRAELLARLGVPFTTAAPSCDEEALKQPGMEPAELAQFLAREKALSVARANPTAFVLGGDQVVELEQQVLGKPHTHERAVAQLLQMRGKSHRLLTAICLISPGGEQRTHLDVHTLSMHALSEESLRRYVVADEPLDCAGSYKIESRGIALFSRIQGEDFTAIPGLPLLKLSEWLIESGFRLP
jgi:septum formation protein